MSNILNLPKEVTLTSGPQYYNMFNTEIGFQCLKSNQHGQEDCLDYEVQLCCPCEKVKFNTSSDPKKSRISL
jgi:hypothetical protein